MTSAIVCCGIWDQWRLWISILCKRFENGYVRLGDSEIPGDSKSVLALPVPIKVVVRSSQRHGDSDRTICHSCLCFRDWFSQTLLLTWRAFIQVQHSIHIQKTITNAWLHFSESHTRNKIKCTRVQVQRNEESLCRKRMSAPWIIAGFLWSPY